MSTRNHPTKDSALPKISRPLMGGFRLFNQRYLKRHFHVIAANQAHVLEAGIGDTDSVVFFANHASWWDPLTAMFLADSLFPSLRMYAPIDAEAFEKYRMFGQMGFYPVAGSLHGAADFLKTSRRILAEMGTSIWITPEGRFADVRDSSASLMPGLAHLAASLSRGQAKQQKEAGTPRVWFVALALEYTFWEERTPELLVWFGKPIALQLAAQEMSDSSSKAEWDTRLTELLRDTQQRLAGASIARDDSLFEVLLRNRSGTFFLYDWYRRVKGHITGKAIEVSHSDKFAE